MRQEDLLQLVGDLARRVSAAERRPVSLPPLSTHGSSEQAGVLSFIRLNQAMKAGWATPGAWEPLVYYGSPALVRGASLQGTAQGVRIRRSGVFRITASCAVRSTSPGSDAWLGVLVDGSPLDERVKLDPEDLVWGATGLYYDGSSLTALASLTAGSLVAAALNVQGNPGLTTLENEGSLVLEQVA